MKKPFYKQVWFWIVFGIAIVVFVFNLMCAYKHPEERYSNWFTAISGWVSGISTIVLGTIAVWQNKRYKKLADDYNDKLLMPELFCSSSILDKMNNASLFEWVKGEIPNDIDSSRCQPIPVWFVRGPILNVKALSVTQENYTEEFILGEQKSFRNENNPFGLVVQVPKSFLKKDSRIVTVIEYENIYGTKYNKSISFNLNNSLEATNIKIEPARRVEQWTS